MTWNQYLALKLYYLIFLFAYFYRYFMHRGDGIINRKESKPWTFKVKVALQVLMTITTLAMCVEDLIDNWDTQKDSVFWNIVYILPAALWALSVHLQYFEYKRNMPHRWYAHLAFWLLSAIMCAIILILQFVTMDHEYKNKIAFIATHGVSCLLSSILSYLGLKYSHDQP